MTELLPRPTPTIGHHACNRWMDRVEPLDHLRYDVALQMASAAISAIVEEGEEVDARLLTGVKTQQPPNRYFRDRHRPQVVVPVNPATWTVTTVLVIGAWDAVALEEATQ
jgi:hypothetical protein